MLHSKAGEAYKMNAHHVPLRQSVEEIRLGKEQEEGGARLNLHTLSKETRCSKCR